MERAVLINNAAYKDYVPAVDKIKFEHIETVTVRLQNSLEKGFFITQHRK